MAKTNSIAPLLISLAFILSVLFSAAEGKRFGFSQSQKLTVQSCQSVYGVQPKDTCFAVQQKFKLEAADFSNINPNLVCEKLFVGQWLCVAGTVGF